MSNQSKLAALASTGVTKAELDNIDGGTARGTTAIIDADGVLVNDAGTMRMTTMATLATYMGTKIGGGMEFIASSGVINNAASAIFTQFDASKYDHYYFYCQSVIPITDNTDFYGHVSTDAGSNYDTTDGNYHSDGSGDGRDEPGFVVARATGNATNESGICGMFEVHSPHLTTFTRASSVGISTQNGLGPNGSNMISPRHSENFHMHLAAQDTDAIKFAFSSGNIKSGEITMFGIVNS